MPAFEEDDGLFTVFLLAFHDKLQILVDEIGHWSVMIGVFTGFKSNRKERVWTGLRNVRNDFMFAWVGRRGNDYFLLLLFDFDFVFVVVGSCCCIECNRFQSYSISVSVSESE